MYNEWTGNMQLYEQTQEIMRRLQECNLVYGVVLACIHVRCVLLWFDQNNHIMYM